MRLSSWLHWKPNSPLPSPHLASRGDANSKYDKFSGQILCVATTSLLWSVCKVFVDQLALLFSLPIDNYHLPPDKAISRSENAQ